MNNIWLSVIVPVYNTERYISNCLNSIINQYIDGVEIICVNDGSIDDSSKILREYEDKYSFIKVVEQSNGGASVARNAGLAIANGEYVTFLDSDDIYEKDAIATMKEQLEMNKPDLLCYDARCVYENESLKGDDNLNKYYTRKKEYGGPYDGQKLFCEFIENEDLSIAVWNICIKRSLIKDNGLSFAPGIIYEDGLFLFYVYMKAKRVFHIKQKLTVYCVRNNSVMTSPIKGHNIASYVFLIRDLIKYVINNQCSFELENSIARFCIEIIENAKYTDARMSSDERAKLGKVYGIDGIIAACMGIGNYGNHDFCYKMYKTGFDKYLLDAQSIILYGAGKIGKMTYDYIEKSGYAHKVEKFVVSDDKGLTVSEIKGVPVKVISDCEDKNTLLIITAAKKYAVDMYKNAMDKGFINIEKIDYTLEKIIDENLHIDEA